MAFLNNVRIRNKLILVYLISVIIPIFVVTFFLTNRLYVTSSSSMIALANANANQLGSNFTTRLSENSDVLRTITSNDAFMRYIFTEFTDYRESLRELKTLKPMLRGYQRDNVIIRVYSDNETIGFSGITNNSLAYLSRQEWYNDLERETDGISWTGLTQTARLPSQNHLGAYRVYTSRDASDEILALVAVFFDETDMFRFIAEESEEGVVVFLLDDQGQMITSSERDMLHSNKYDIIGNLADYNYDVEQGSLVDFNDDVYFFISTSIACAENHINDWTLIYMVLAEDIINSIRAIWITSLVLILASIFFSLTFYLIISFNITKRITLLKNEIKKVQRNDFNVSIESSGSDEIGDLEQNVSFMVESMEILINEVYETNLRLKDTELNNQKSETEKREMEIIALQNQMNPHYFYNTLDCIRMNLILNEDRETAKIIKLFADSFRNCMEWENDTIPLTEELAFTRNYLIIQKYRFADKFNYQIDVFVESSEYKVPKLIIQPLVENAIYHGLEMKEGGGKIYISISKTEDELRIKVEDDGVGIAVDDLNRLRESIQENKSYRREKERYKRRSIALGNINQRISLLFGSKYGLSINSVLGDGTVLEINLPIGDENHNVGDSNV